MERKGTTRSTDLAGNDHLVGGAGSDSLEDGAGNDILEFDLTDSLADGGDGTDTLRITDTGGSVDLTVLAGSTVLGVEIIDLGESGTNSLTLDLQSILTLSDSNTLRVDGTGSISCEQEIAGRSWPMLLLMAALINSSPTMARFSWSTPISTVPESVSTVRKSPMTTTSRPAKIPRY